MSIAGQYALFPPDNSRSSLDPSGIAARALRADRRQLELPPLDRRRNLQAVAVFRHRAAGDDDIGLAQPFDDAVVGQDVVRDPPRRSSAGCAAAPPRRNATRPSSSDGMAAVKKYFISNSPRGVWMNLCAVARETVDSCTPIASPIIFRLRGLSADTPSTRKASCRRTISVATLRMVRARCSRLLVSQLADWSWAETYCLSSSRLAPRLMTRRIDVVDQHARQRLAVELDAPGPVGRSQDIDVGNRGRAGRVAEGAAGLRFEAPDLGDHVGEVLVVDAADLAQQGKVASRQRRQIGDHRLHRRIEAVALDATAAQGTRRGCARKRLSVRASAS